VEAASVPRNPKKIQESGSWFQNLKPSEDTEGNRYGENDQEVSSEVDPLGYDEKMHLPKENSLKPQADVRLAWPKPIWESVKSDTPSGISAEDQSTRILPPLSPGTVTRWLRFMSGVSL